MGIVNLTPNSFSDGGQFTDSHGGVQVDAAVAHARRLATEGARILDIGGEASSFFRSGVVPISPEEQIRRIVPVIKTLADDVRPQPNRPLISVDTRSSIVARAAVEAGADMINDISAGTFDPRMFQAVAQLGVPIVLMHSRPEMPGEQPAPYEDVAAEVCSDLTKRLFAAREAGIAPHRLLIDPGLGFGKRPDDNWALLRQLPQLLALGHLVVLGASRKRFLAMSDTRHWPAPTATPSRALADPRDATTAIVTALAAQAGVLIHRVHQVPINAAALTLVGRWRGIEPAPSALSDQSPKEKT
jgi:dihydropteroate synthase